MREIVREYGGAVLAAIAGMLVMGLTVFVLQLMGEYLSQDGVETVQETGQVQGNAQNETLLSVTPNKELLQGHTYPVAELLSMDGGGMVSGGKVLQVWYYDGLEAAGEEDLSASLLEENGREICFTNRGLYRLCVALRDNSGTETLQYVWVAIEGELFG